MNLCLLTQVNMVKTNAMIFSRKKTTTVKDMYGLYYKHRRRNRVGGGVGWGGGARSCPQAPVILIPSRIGTNDSSAVNFKNLEQGFIKIIFNAFCFLDDIWYSKEKRKIRV